MSRIFQIKVHVVPASLGEEGVREDSPLRFQASDDTYFVTGDELGQVRALGIVAEVVSELAEQELPVRFLLPHGGAVNDYPPEDARLSVLARLLSEGRAGGEVHIRFIGRNRTVPPSGFTLDRAGGNRRYVWQVVPSDDVQSPFADRFACLRERFSSKDTRVALALGSGGLKLFCHATALRLLERTGCADHIDEVWGSSAGALVALLYSYGLSPTAIEQAGYDIYSGRWQLPLRPTTFQVLRQLVREAVFSNSASETAGFVDCAKALSGMLDRYCDEDEPLWPFFALAFNVEECRTEVLTPSRVPTHLRSFVAQADARSAALASAAVPLLFHPHYIERGSHHRVPYIDGSTTEDVPLHSVVRKWDHDRATGVERREKLVVFYVKLTGNVGQYRSRDAHVSKLRLLQIVASAGIQTMHERDLELASGRPDVELYGLDLQDSSPDFFESRRVAEFIRLAKESFPRQLDEIERRLREG